jgi:hypothetical protein
VIFANVADDNGGSSARQRGRDPKADAARTPRNQGDTILQFDGWNHYMARAAADVPASSARNRGENRGHICADERSIVDRAISDCEDVAPKRRARTIAALCHEQHGLVPSATHFG